MTDYPPEPWSLRGDFAVSVLLAPPASVPAGLLECAPAGARPLRIGGRLLVGLAAVHYGRGGMLAYEERLLAVPGLWRGRLRVTIPQVLGTSRASVAGGRVGGGGAVVGVGGGVGGGVVVAVGDGVGG